MFLNGFEPFILFIEINCLHDELLVIFADDDLVVVHIVLEVSVDFHFGPEKIKPVPEASMKKSNTTIYAIALNLKKTLLDLLS